MPLPLARVPKRSKAAERGASGSADGADDEGIELADFCELERSRALIGALYSPINSSSVYNMMHEGDKARLAADLWTGDFGKSMAGVREANQEFVSVLRAQITNSTRPTAQGLLADERHIDGILLDVVRSQNCFCVPLVAAATSLLGEVNKTAREVHDASAVFHMGTTMSEKWTEDFCCLSMRHRPPPDYETLPGVVVCCFDNLSMQIDYKSYASEGEVGRRLDMTNWFSCPLPRSLAPTLDAAATCAPRGAALPVPARPCTTCSRAHCLSADRFAVRNGVFRKDLSLRQFSRLFYVENADLRANKTARWKLFLARAREGRMLDRPQAARLWRPHKIYHTPMWDVLQSSYAQTWSTRFESCAGWSRPCLLPRVHTSHFRSCLLLETASL